eukprot:GEMP01026627.1.p1 GENE.GEMP01026627.1~~GEMP01026627.1.p1  ORF type:complete len:639 (+),score=174.93 GEMP01026627.1:148-2064(+)
MKASSSKRVEEREAKLEHEWPKTKEEKSKFKKELQKQARRARHAPEIDDTPHDIEVASSPSQDGNASDACSSGDDDNRQPDAEQPRELRGALKGLPTPESTGSATTDDAIDVLVRALQRWSKDPKMTMRAREKAVRSIYAIWHPDKNPENAPLCTAVFQAMQNEVRRLLELKRRLRERHAEVMATRDEKREQKQMLKRKCPELNSESDDEEIPELVKVANAERPWPRSHFSMFAVDGALHIFGGEWYDGKTYHTYGDMLSFRDDRWTQLYQCAPGVYGPPPRSGHVMCPVGGALYLFGGEFTSKDQRRFKQYADLWKYAGNKWELVPAKDGPTARSGHRGCAVGPMFFVFGGFSERVGFPLRYHNDLFIFDTVAQAWKKDRRKGTRPEARSAALMWGGVGCFYLYGGSRPSKNRSLHVFDDLWRCTDEGWEGPFSTSGPKRHGMCVTALSHDKAIFFGGVADAEEGGATSSTFHGDLFVLDMPSNDASGMPDLAKASWTHVDVRPGPCGRFASQCAVLQGALWIFGGSCEYEEQERTLDDLWRFDFQSRRWQNVVPPSERSGVWHEEPEEQKPVASAPSTGCTTVSLVCDIDPMGLSKKERVKWEKRQRMEVKKVKMDEKEQKKLGKKLQKQEDQKNK